MILDEITHPGLPSHSGLSYEIWIGEVDAAGERRNPRVLSAAHRLKTFFLWYRRAELGCPSLANTLAEEAVDNACEVLTRGEIRNPQAYLRTVFKHAVDRYLRRERRLVPMEFESDSERLRKEFVSEEDVGNLERQIQIAQILAAMDEQTLSIFAGRRAGYTGEEIAKRLGMTTSALYTSYCRGLARVIEKFGLSATGGDENRNVDGGERKRKRRPERRSEISDTDRPEPRGLSNSGSVATRRR